MAANTLGRIQGIGSLGLMALLLGACSPQAAPNATAPTLRPVASIQELMQDVIDPCADGVWNAVETVTTQAGDQLHQPQTPDEWRGVRRAAMGLVEGTNLLVMDGRRVGAKEFAAEAAGALDSAHIQQRIAADRTAFEGFAAALREGGLSAIAAVDAKDPAALLAAGGALDQVCENCHLAFWYPNQVIPSFPRDDDPRHPIFRSGT